MFRQSGCVGGGESAEGEVVGSLESRMLSFGGEGILIDCNDGVGLACDRDGSRLRPRAGDRRVRSVFGRGRVNESAFRACQP